ncbi:Ran-interacting Mog1 protein [Trypanosoma melophagium]|uniref:Ran-interacting Mog1 protein n=1 Tax=Trypanosoma melophagium TaxID=715481 RepID=UPI00351A6336|nr:Ran-interacting Mog1 protein [Trypanosoma melophagium]
MEEKEVQLFGGAITCVVPTTAVDVSDFRQVPDTQEVYTEAETGVSIIVELLARERSISDGNCGVYFYTDLARANDCGEGDYIISTQQQLSPSDYPNVAPRLETTDLNNNNNNNNNNNGQQCVYGCCVSGIQRISKYTNEKGKENEVLVVLAVLRFLPPVSTDILLSISAPQLIHPESSEARVVSRRRSEAEVQEIMRRMLHTFTVKDWGLFVPEE